MRKIFSVALLSAMLFAQSCDAYTDPAFEIGRSIGSAIGDAVASQPAYRGTVNKEYHVEKYYDTSKLKKFIVIAYVPQGEEMLVQNKYATQDVMNAIAEELTKEYNVVDFVKGTQPLFVARPEILKMPYEQGKGEIERYIRNTYDGTITAKIHSYCIYQGNAFCDIEIIVDDVECPGIAVAYFREQRLDVPNRQPSSLAKKALSSFNNKFKTTFKNARRDNK